MPLPDRAAIEAALPLIRDHVRHTPLLAVPEIGATGSGAILKLECLQHAGSFKPRGAFLNLLTREVPGAGVVAASGGNHGAAVAHAAAALGHRATIFVPELSSPAKRALIRRLGAEVVVTGATYAEALAASEAYRAETGAITVHAYDAPETVTGQGTVGAEFEADAPGLDTVLVAVGGGGLIGGITAWYAGRTAVVGVEPEACPTLHTALAAGAPVDVEVGGKAADSLGARRIGEIAFAVASRHLACTVLVSDAEIVAAQTWCWHHLNLAVEPGGATALAALLSGRYAPAPGEKIGVVMCGANVDLASIPV